MNNELEIIIKEEVSKKENTIIFLDDLLKKVQKRNNTSSKYDIKKTINILVEQKTLTVNEDEWIGLTSSLEGKKISDLQKDTNKGLHDNLKEDEEFNEDFSTEIKCESKSYTWTPWQIKQMIDEKEIFIPPYQRNFKWNQRQASLFIESIIFGLPVPNIFIYKNDKNQFQIIDGQQRITSLFSFMSNKSLPGMKIPFKLQNNVAKKFQGRFFTNNNNKKSLDDNSIFRLKHYPMNVVEFFPDKNNSEMLFQLFKRLNSGGTTLTEHEIRRVVNRTKFYVEVEKLSTEPNWLLYFDRKAKDGYVPFGVLLRAILIFCFYDYNKNVDADNRFKNLNKELDNFSEAIKYFSSDENNEDISNYWSFKYFKYKDWTPDTVISELISLARKAIAKIYNKFDENVFRGQSWDDSTIIGGSNKKPIIDSIFTLCQIIDLDAFNKEEVIAKRESAVLKESFIQTYTSSTSTNNIISRIDILKNTFLNSDKDE